VFEIPDRLEAWVSRELRKPVPTDPARKARIMELVRAAGPRRVARLRRLGGGPRAGWASPFVGMLLAAGVCGVMTFGAARPLAFRDPRLPAATAVTSALGDTVASTLRDTVRLVRSALARPAAARAALAVGAGRWTAAAVPTAVADASGVSMVAVALAPSRHRAAPSVDAGWNVGRESRPAGDSGRPLVLHATPDTAS
jgi:hypothetical protein